MDLKHHLEPDARSEEARDEASLGTAKTLTAPPAPGGPSFRTRSGRDRFLHQLNQPAAPPAVDLASRKQLGRYRLLEKLGEGGMGVVYCARDESGGGTVAIKVLRPEWSARAQALQRFQKEARLLAELTHPNVVRLLDVNEDDGLVYLVLEFVPGPSLGKLLDEQGRLPESLALAIMADVARALAEAHDRDIVHRDVKPDNILLRSADLAAAPSGYQAKVTDFGLARHVIEAESLQVTRTGAILGTPSYMAPEQCLGDPVDPRTDVYALGATLFHLLAGRPPFLAAETQAVMAMHRMEPPPRLQQLNPDLSEGVCRLVEKCLAKVPGARYLDAAALLRDLERLLRGEPPDLPLHPALPAADPRQVLAYNFQWQLGASPEQLWPYVSNTDRLNRAAGLPAVEFSALAGPGTDSPAGLGPAVRRFGRFRKAGLSVAWEEHPFEWVEGQRHGVLREYSQGPFRWLVSAVELTPRPEGGTTLTHRLRLVPRGWLGRAAARVMVGLQGRRGLDRVYRRIDAFLTGKRGDVTAADPFEDPALLTRARRRRLERGLDELRARGVAPAVVERLGDFLAHAPAQEVARIRPLALARRWGLDAGQVVAACLHGARAGLLVLLWDILCPGCRIPSDVKDTLRAVREHGHCDACGLDFELDFAGSVEMIFRAHPEVRVSDLGTYCVGGPAHSPHVVAQVRLQPAERLELDLALPEGAYRLRGPQLPFALDFRVEPLAPTRHWEVRFMPDARPSCPVLRSGGQALVLTNDHAQELLVRVERAASREDALTAARASALALFRDLFPGEVLSPGQLVSVTTLTFLTTDLDRADRLYEELGDARAFAVLHEHFRRLEACIRREGGAVVQTVGEGMLAVFHDAAAAVKAGLAIIADGGLRIADSPAPSAILPRVAIHRGPALATTRAEHLDYFGTTVRQALRLPQLGQGGELVLTRAVTDDPQATALLRTAGVTCAVRPVIPDGQPECVVYRSTAAAAGSRA